MKFTNYRTEQVLECYVLYKQVNQAGREQIPSKMIFDIVI